MKKTVVSLALALAGTVAFAQDGAKDVTSATSLPAPLQLAAQAGVKVERTFPAAGGLTGWVISQGPGKYSVVYTPADGSVVIIGNVVTAQGENLSDTYVKKYAPEPDYEQAWKQVEKSDWVAEGAKDPKSVIYVFKDPNCGYCHLAWKAFQPYMKAGLQVRWIPVAFLRPDSINKAAMMLEASDKEQVIKELHANLSKRESGMVDPATRKKVEANNELMRALGFTGTPATLYRDAKGKVKVINGMPGLSELPEITGLPEQPINDPELARYR